MSNILVSPFLHMLQYRLKCANLVFSRGSTLGELTTLVVGEGILRSLMFLVPSVLVIGGGCLHGLEG